MQQPEIKITSNIWGLDQALPPEGTVRHEYVGHLTGSNGLLEFVRICCRSDLVILDDDQKKLLLACAVRPFFRFKLVSVDLVLRRPKTLKGRISTLVRRLFLSSVDQFILYFKDTRGYEEVYGIGPDRAVYVPFKVNGWETLPSSAPGPSDGAYVLCAGRTLRDIGTFVAAMDRALCPGILLQQEKDLLEAHGTSAWTGALPRNLTLVVDDGDRLESFLDFIARARLVVIPRFRGDIAPTGIGTYLIAMALNRCVIISAGPGADDVLTDQAVIVPPEDVDSLAEKIKLLWHDHEACSTIASRGLNYARALKGEERLWSDVLKTSMQVLGRKEGHRVVDV